MFSYHRMVELKFHFLLFLIARLFYRIKRSNSLRKKHLFPTFMVFVYLKSKSEGDSNTQLNLWAQNEWG